MLPGHHFALDGAHSGVVLFLLGMTFLLGAFGGFFFGMTHALRHIESKLGSKSIWTFDDET